MITSMDPILNLAKRRGFLFNSAEIYNGAGGLYDLGPLGVELSNNIKKSWWRQFVYGRDDMLGVDSAILTPAAVLKASGHVDGFSDPLIECKVTHIRLRADHYLEEEDVHIWMQRWMDEIARQRGRSAKQDEQAALDAARELYDFDDPEHPRLRPTASYRDLVCPHPDNPGKTFTEPKQFNMMFKTYLGPVEDSGATVYLRPETAQGIFTNFKNVLDTYHKKLPFGIAQIGKAFRNEITIGNSLFRVREFEQMEIEYFVQPGTDEDAFPRWVDEFEAFLTHDLGISKERLRRYEHPKEKLSHYSKRTIDFEYDFPALGFGELMGIANRSDYDLRQHQEASKKELGYYDEERKERYLPFVLEPSMGLGRAFLTVLTDSYREYPQGRDGKGTEMETVLHLPAAIAPVAVAVLPLMKKDGLAEKAREVHAAVRAILPDRLTVYEESGAIGRRYRKQDEIGTPLCLTIDYQTLEDGTLTVRDRDTMEQKRVAIADLAAIIRA